MSFCKFSECNYWQTIKLHEAAWMIWQTRTRIIPVAWITGTRKTDEEIKVSNFQVDQLISSRDIKEPVYKRIDQGCLTTGARAGWVPWTI